MTKHGWQYCEAFRLASTFSKHPNLSLIPSLSSGFKECRPREWNLERRSSFASLLSFLCFLWCDTCETSLFKDSLMPDTGQVDRVYPLPGSRTEMSPFERAFYENICFVWRVNTLSKKKGIPLVGLMFGAVFQFWNKIHLFRAVHNNPNKIFFK